MQIRAGVADLDSIYTLNETASWIWERLDGATNDQALVAAMVEHFEVDPDTAAADLARVLDELCDEGLARRQPAAGAEPDERRPR